MKLPIFKYFDPFNGVESKTSDKYSSLAYFFMCFEKSEKAGNNPVLMMASGRFDRKKTPIFSGDILRSDISFTKGNAYHGDEEDYEGHRIGVVRYQPSKGFVVSRAVECWDDGDGVLGDYKKVHGAFTFSQSNATVLGNIHVNDEFYDAILYGIKRRAGES